MEVVTLLVSIVSTVGAVVAALYARGQANSAATSANAAERSATADQTTAELDAQRRHDELTPHFLVTLKKPEAGSDMLHLSLFLGGPSALDRLDGLTVKILDDRTLHEYGTRRAAGLGDPERVTAQIWAAYCFAADVHVDETGRTAQYRRVALGDVLKFSLERTVPPSWLPLALQDWWVNDQTRVLLQLVCVREGWDPWRLQCEMEAARLPGTVEIRKTT